MGYLIEQWTKNSLSRKTTVGVTQRDSHAVQYGFVLDADKIRQHNKKVAKTILSWVAEVEKVASLYSLYHKGRPKGYARKKV